MTNPNGAAFWIIAFAAVLSLRASLWFYVPAMALVATLSLFRQLVITLVFGAPKLQRFYRRIERGVNAAAGTGLMALGLQRQPLVDYTALRVVSLSGCKAKRLSRS